VIKPSTKTLIEWISMASSQSHRRERRLTAWWSKSACSRTRVAFMDADVWSIYGAERSQLVATGDKWDCLKTPRTSQNRCRGLRPVAKRSAW
jgi:hypothetical protein